MLKLPAKSGLRGALDERSMSIRELSLRTGISPGAINSWMTTGVQPRCISIGSYEDVSAAIYGAESDKEGPNLLEGLRIAKDLQAAINVASSFDIPLHQAIAAVRGEA